VVKHLILCSWKSFAGTLPAPVCVDRLCKAKHNKRMFEKIEYNKSAFKHKISEEDVRWAFFHYRYDCPEELCLE